MGAIITLRATSRILSILDVGVCMAPFHLFEDFLSGFAETFRSNFFGLIVYDDHSPNRLGDLGNHPIEQRAQKSAAPIAINGITVFLFCQKAETTKTVRAFNPPHRKRWRTDKLPLDGYLPISRLRRQPIRTQSGDRQPPTYFL